MISFMPNVPNRQMYGDEELADDSWGWGMVGWGCNEVGTGWDCGQGFPLWGNENVLEFDKVTGATAP